MNTDEQYMMRAIELAERGAGLTRPNPPVGAVLVRDGRIVAEGWHEQAGSPHAEVNCLQSATGDLASATLYVTLEPCSTQGLTPPCTDLILEKGVGRLVVAVADLNPRHSGRGLEILKTAGIEVVCGICEKEARGLMAPFEKFITTGMPYVTLKLASTLDGRIADSQGDSKWITGREARERVQQMRRRADAIMVGAGTVRADDPSLLPRPDEGRRPFRVIMGDQVPDHAKVLNDEASEQTLIYSGNLAAAMRDLAEEHGVMHVLCEGGGILAAGLVEEGLVDQFAFFIAPKLMGADGLPCFAKTGGLMADVKNLTFRTVERVGDDILITATLEE